MFVTTVRRILLAAAVLAGAALGSGCYVDLPPPESVEGGYQPMYYEGAVVYYDDGGRPYYYDGGSVRWVPAGYAHYHTYVNHYRSSYQPYRHWYTRGGYRYKAYRHR
jgi:hypothetical protein